MKIKQSALFSDKRIFIFFSNWTASKPSFIFRYQTKRKTNPTHWIKLNFLTPIAFRPKMPFSDGPNPAAWRVTAFKHTVCQKKYVFSKFFWQIKIAKKLHFIDNLSRSVGSVHPTFPISGEHSLRAAALNNDFVFVYSLCFIALPVRASFLPRRLVFRRPPHRRIKQIHTKSSNNSFAYCTETAQDSSIQNFPP